MAVAFASVQTTVPVTTTSFTITKPTSLAVGDLLLAHIGNFTAGSPVINLPSGWTSVFSQTNGNHINRVMYKIADSSDVAASNFTFTGSGTGANMGGALYRITGFGPTSVIDVSNSTTWSGTSANLAIGVTPTRASGLMIIFVGAGSSNSGGIITGYAIATDNPSWTEAYDFDTSETADANRLAAAYAIRTETTATGNVSFSAEQAVSAGVAGIISIFNTQDASSTPDPAISSNTINSPTVTGGITIAVSPVVSTGTINSHVSDQADWSAQGKSSSPTWTSQTKS